MLNNFQSLSFIDWIQVLAMTLVFFTPYYLAYRYQRKQAKTTVENIVTELKKESVNNNYLQEKKDRLKYLQSLMYCPVYAFDDTWNDPKIGFVIGIKFTHPEEWPVPVIKDYITGITAQHHSAIIRHKSWIYEQFINLDPKQRWLLCSGIEFTQDDFNSVIKLGDFAVQLLSPARITSLLMSNNFRLAVNGHPYTNKEQLKGIK